MVSAARLSEDRRQRLEGTNKDLQRLSAHVMNVQDDERRRLARELHDSVGQYLAAIKMSCEVVLQETKHDSAVTALADSLTLLDRCTMEVRTMSHLLHPPLLEEMGLGSAVPWYVEGFTERSGIAVELDMSANLHRLSAPIELALFRVLQESLTNIHRHSQSKLAKIRLLINDHKVLLAVEDYGKGFPSGLAPAPKAGVGIAGMRERVRELGGELQVNSGSHGTTVEAMVPLPKEVRCQSVSSS
jgi:signal transduction histidine kinase